MATRIGWTGETWNVFTGCSKISEGCRNCYAEELSLRYGWSKKPWIAKHAKENLVFHEDRLKKPYSWKKPTECFVNSMSDMFHEAIAEDQIRQVFEVMNDPDIIEAGHIFQILTKRANRLKDTPDSWWTPNIWQGVSVEDRKNLGRIDALKRCSARIKFVSFEPLLESLGELDLSGIDWAIVGGESGPNFRPMDHAWAREIRDQCLAQDVEFFFKQSAALRNETGKGLIEADSSQTVWQFYPIDGQRYKDSDGVVPYRFDGYQELDEAEQSEVDSYTQKIRSQISDMLKNVLEIGKHLCEVQTLLANHHKGTFVSWLETDFGWSFRSAYYLISVYERFGSFANFAELPIGQSALYLLAADSTPEQARDEAIQRAEDGEAITNKTAKEIVGRHREIIVQTTSDSVGAEDEVEWSESEKERRDAVNLGQTVVANLHKGEDEALRAWATEKGLAVRIDRKSRSDWENPFVVDADGTREEVIEHYKWYYERKRSLKRQIKTLRGKVLLCWCHPEPCHGDFLAEEAMDIPELF